MIACSVSSTSSSGVSGKRRRSAIMSTMPMSAGNVSRNQVKRSCGRMTDQMSTAKNAASRMRFNTTGRSYCHPESRRRRRTRIVLALRVLRRAAPAQDDSVSLRYFRFDDDFFDGDFFEEDFFDGDFFDDDFFDEDFFDGTLPPALRASDNPIAIACLRLVTFLPERPLFSVPRFFSCIAFSTFCDAFLPYFDAIHTSVCRNEMCAKREP